MHRLLVGLCALSALLASAAPTANSTDAPDDVERTVLPSGLVVLTKERPDPDAVAINVAVRAGSRDEDEATSGAAHFMEHLFFQGTPRRPTALDVQRPITSRGGTLNATTGWELINFDAVVRSSIVALSDTGAWVAAAGVDPENVDLVTDLILAEVHRLRDEPLTDAELDDAKSYLEGRYVLGLETNVGQARRFAGQEALGLREPIAQSIARIQAVTAADVQRVAREYLDVANFVRVVVEP